MLALVLIPKFMHRHLIRLLIPGRENGGEHGVFIRDLPRHVCIHPLCISASNVHPSIQRFDLPAVVKRIVKHLLREAKTRSRVLIAVTVSRHFDR